MNSKPEFAAYGDYRHVPQRVSAETLAMSVAPETWPQRIFTLKAMFRVDW
jgi:hypothetical protein